jgi:hypothetical protein
MLVASADAQSRGEWERCTLVRKQATNDEWRAYYDRAAEVRAIVGDPFKRHLQREAFRERILMIGSVVSVLATIAAFCLFTMR